MQTQSATVSTNRDTATNTLNQDGLGLPVLFRQTSRLGPPTISR